MKEITVDLNKPPPGASDAKEIVPAVLRSSAPVGRASATDALGAMLQGSRSWDSVATPVTRTVTLLSWLLLALDIVAVVVTRACIGESDLYARVVTWDYHSGAAIVVAVLASLVMIATAFNTRGLRRANLSWLRVWIGGVVVSLIAIAAMVVATAIVAIIAMVVFAVVFFTGIAALDGV